MNARIVTERLIWLKQHALGNREEAPRIRAAYVDELHTRAAQLGTSSRSDPDYTAHLIDVLVTEIAHTRNRLGLVTDPRFDINPAEEMTGDVYADVTLTGDLDHVTDAQLAAIDLLASLFGGGPDWRIRIEVDPGTVITATPPRRTPPAEQPSEAPLAPEDGEDG